MNRETRYFSKLSNKHQSALEKKQEKFYIENEQFIENILRKTNPKEMSKDIISSIEASYLLSYSYKLRVLADEQKIFFNN